MGLLQHFLHPNHGWIYLATVGRFVPRRQHRTIPPIQKIKQYLASQFALNVAWS